VTELRGSRVILVVDDHADTADFLCRVLSRKGYDTHCAHDGAAALDVLATRTPRLIVLDVQMPRLTGLEVLAAMRAAERLRTIPVIVYSAGHDKAQADHAIRLGAREYLVKGAVSVAEILRLVAKHASPAATA
jgi:CheY-like chemotaxis protein